MTLRELLDSRLIIEIMGEKEGSFPDVYKSAGIECSVFCRWRRRAEQENPEGLYAELRDQIKEANNICKSLALARVQDYAKEITITKTITRNDGSTAESVTKRPDVNAALFILQSRFPEYNIKSAMNQAAIEAEVERRMKQLTETPQLPVIPVETMEQETDPPSNK